MVGDEKMIVKLTFMVITAFLLFVGTGSCPGLR